MSRWPPAAVLAVGLLLASACGTRSARFSSVEVLSSGHEALLDRLSIDRAALESATRDALLAAGFRQGEGSRSYRVRTRVVSVRAGPRPESEGVFAELVLDMELVPGTGLAGVATVAATGTGSAQATRRLDAAAWMAALSNAARKASASLYLAHSAESKPEDRLIADLSAQDPRLREQAIRVLEGRRSVRAVPFLIERLNDPEPDLVERAAGALSQIRDPRAVPALIDLSRRGEDPSQIARFARLIGDVGGSEARGYLETLESGHQDPRVRAAAAEALEDVDAREQEERRMADGGSPAARTPDSGKMSR